MEGVFLPSLLMGSLSPREELIRIQRQIFRKNQRIIEDSILVSEKGFYAYEKNYQRRVRDFQTPVTLGELKRALRRAQWIYMGDYHTNRQSQRALLRVLKLLIGQQRNFVIALEFIQKKHQEVLDKFLKKKMSLNSFLKFINVKKNFHFDLWENFEPIFDFARYYRLQVFGIESAPYGSGLKKRDQAMAKTLAEIRQRLPETKILTFVGDLHIAPENLPHQVKKAVGPTYEENKEIYLYQNSEKIYWKLATDHREEEVEIVRIDSKSFCLINTPPIVWQQSYLNWLENEEEEIDYLDPRHSFLDLTKRIAGFLRLKLPRNKEEVEVFTCGDFSFLERLKEDHEFSSEEKKQIKRQVELSESYYIPKRKWVYLANISLNHAAEEASHFIRHLMAGDDVPKGAQDIFYGRVLQEALGFFGSKIVNPKRKCLRVRDFESMVDYFRRVKVPRDRTFELEVGHSVLELKKMEKQNRALANPQNMIQHHDLFFGVSHALGYMLGEILYHAMMKGKLTKKEIGKLFRDSWMQEGKAFWVYGDLMARFASLPLPQRF